MRALVKQGRSAADTAVVSTQVPTPGHGQVLFRTEAVGLCGSDVHAWQHDAGYEWVPTPVTLGHEAVGLVSDVGPGVDPDWIGKRAVPISIDGCGRCRLCQSGRGYICPDRTVLGLSFDGAAAEACVIDANRLVEVPRGISANAMVLVEPLAIALHTVSWLLGNNPSLHEEIIVTGPGPIGIMAALILHRQGYGVTLVGAESDVAVRLAKAELLGLRTRAGEQLLESASSWLEASGSSQALATAIRHTNSGGMIVVPAIFSRIPEVDINLITRKEITLVGSYGASRSDYTKASCEIVKDPHFWEQLVTPFHLNDGAEALNRIRLGEVVKAILIPETCTSSSKRSGCASPTIPN